MRTTTSPGGGAASSSDQSAVKKLTIHSVCTLLGPGWPSSGFPNMSLRTQVEVLDVLAIASRRLPVIGVRIEAERSIRD